MAGTGPNGGYGPWTPGVATPPGPAAWPAGQTWPLRPSGQVFANDLNQQLSLPVTFLARKPMFQANQLTGQAIPSGTATAINLDTETSDAWGMHSTESDTSVVAIPSGYGGVYLVQGSVPYAATASGAAYEADIWLNGAVYTKGERWEATGIHATPGVADLITITGGEFVRLGAWQSSGKSVNTYCQNTGTAFLNAGYPQLTLRWVSALSGTNGLSVPSPVTWTANEEVTSALFNSNIRDAVNYLSYVPVCRAVQGTANTIPSSTQTQVTGLSANIDNYSAFSGGTTWTAPKAGLYLLSAQVAFSIEPAPFSGNVAISINGTYYSGTKARGENIGSMLLRTFRLNAGDVVTTYAYQNYTASVSTQSGSSTRFFSLWLSA